MADKYVKLDKAILAIRDKAYSILDGVRPEDVNVPFFLSVMSNAVSALREMEPEDAPEIGTRIVRCKDCMYATAKDTEGNLWCDIHKETCRGYAFCSAGRRRRKAPDGAVACGSEGSAARKD